MNCIYSRFFSKYPLKLIAFLCILISHFSILNSFAQSPDSWTQKPDMPLSAGARDRAISFTINGKGYIGLGWDAAGNYYTMLWEYDPVTNAWTQMATFNLAAGRCRAFSFALNGKGYFGTGTEGSNYLVGVFEFDPVANSYQQKANFPGGGRYGASAFVIGQKGYVTGGYNGTTAFADLWEYNYAGDSWIQKASVPQGRYSAVAFTSRGYGYFGTGYGGGYLNDFYKYNPANNSWTSIADFPGGGRALAQAFSLGPRGFVIGGSDATLNHNDVWEYNTYLDQWYQKNNLPAIIGNKFAGSTFVIGNDAYLGVGNNGTAVQRDLWQYNPTPLSVSKFQKSYGGTNDDTDTDSLSSRVCYGSTTNDGGYIIATTSKSFNTTKDIYLIKTNANGDTLWTKTYGTTSVDEIACSVKQTTDGGFIVAGMSGVYNTNTDLLVIKTNSSGVPTWVHNIVQPGIQRANYAEEIPGGGYIVTGRVDGGGLMGAAMIRLNAAGADVGTPRSVLRTGSVMCEGYTIEPSDLGGFTLSGDFITNPGPPDTYMAFADGALSAFSGWTFSGGGPSADERMFAKENPDGSYVVCGTSNSTGSSGGKDIFVMKTTFSPSPSIAWNYHFGGAGDDVARAIVKTPDGGYAIAGFTKSVGAGGEDAFLLKLNSNGVTSWLRTYGGSLNDKANSLAVTMDGGYAIFGETKSYTSGGTNVYFIKTDSAGISGCHESSSTFPGISSFSFTATGPTAVTSNTGTAAGSIISKTIPAGKINLCSQCTFPLAKNRTHVLCYGSCNGTATAVPSGAQAPLSFSWSTTPVQTTQTATGLCAGTYTVTVTDANLCSVTDTIKINQPLAALNLAVANDSVDICVGFSSTLSTSATGGTPNYTYTWQPAAGLSCTTCQNTIATPTLSTTYSVTVKDGNACSLTKTILATVHSPSVNAGPDLTVCSGHASTLNATGSPATYVWTPPAGLSCTSCPNPVATPTSPVTYTVTATDAFGCKKTDAIAISVVPSPTVNISTPSSGTICAGTPITLNGISNGTSYSWSPGGQTTTTVPVAPTITTTYTLTVSSGNSCTSSATYSVNVNPRPVPNFITVNISCNGLCDGKSTANPNPLSSPPFTYQWSTTPVQTTQTSTGLCPGIYSVTVTDSKGCTAFGKDTIVQPNALALGMSSVNAGCTCNGTATAMPGGGTPPYTYQWTTSPVQTTSTSTGLCAGSYSVLVRDSHGCSMTQSATISQSPPVVVTVSPNQTICSGTTTSIGAFVTGTSINYTWNPGGLNGDTVSVTPTGTTNYTVIASNTASGCADTGFVTVNVVSSPTAAITGQDTVCIGTPITLTGSGAGSYLWSPGNQTATFITLNPSATGTTTYTLTITNSSANITCSDIATFTVTAVASPQINLTATTYSLCAGIATDTLSASGGTTYYWTSNPPASYPQNSSIIVSPDVTTTYTVYVSNGLGCSGTSVVTINVSAGYPNPTVTPNPASYCLGDSILPFTAPTPAPPAGVGWTDLQGNLLWLGNVYSPPQNLPAGTYTILCVQGTGSNCLSYPTIVTATIHPLPVANAGGDVTICAGHTAHLQAGGGINFWWSPGTYLSDSLNANPSATPDSTFSYQVIVADANNCKDTDSVTVYISMSDTCGIHIYNGITPNGDGDNDTWFIDGINLYPDNFVEIFNRWGNSVWSGKNYDNRKVVWSGQNMSGQPLPSGTYYYVIDIKELGRFSKWVELTR